MNQPTERMGVIDGKTTDLLIEDLLSLIYQGKFDAPMLNEAYTKIVQEHIHDDCPFLMVSHTLAQRHHGNAVHYLAMLRLDYTVVNSTSPVWPTGGFPDMPDATCAVSIHYPDGERQTDFTPGTNINQAMIAAPIQYARELSQEFHNQPELPLDEGGGGSGYAH